MLLFSFGGTITTSVSGGLPSNGPEARPYGKPSQQRRMTWKVASARCRLVFSVGLEWRRKDVRLEIWQKKHLLK